MTSVSATTSGPLDNEEDCKMIDSIYGAESCQESDEEENAAEIEYRKVRQQIPSTIFPFVVHRWNCQPPRFDPDAAHKQ